MASQGRLHQLSNIPDRLKGVDTRAQRGHLTTHRDQASWVRGAGRYLRGICLPTWTTCDHLSLKRQTGTMLGLFLPSGGNKAERHKHVTNGDRKAAIATIMYELGLATKWPYPTSV